MEEKRRQSVRLGCKSEGEGVRLIGIRVCDLNMQMTNINYVKSSDLLYLICYILIYLL